MKGRMQKIPSKDETCLRKDRAAPERYAGGQTYMWMRENNLTSKDQSGYGLLEGILSPANLNAAYKQVKRNKGSGGVDKLEKMETGQNPTRQSHQAWY